MFNACSPLETLVDKVHFLCFVYFVCKHQSSLVVIGFLTVHISETFRYPFTTLAYIEKYITSVITVKDLFTQCRLVKKHEVSDTCNINFKTTAVTKCLRLSSFGDLCRLLTLLIVKHYENHISVLLLHDEFVTTLDVRTMSLINSCHHYKLVSVDGGDWECACLHLSPICYFNFCYLVVSFIR